MMGGFGLGGIGMLLWVVVVVAAIWWIAQATTRQQGTGPKVPESKTARELLDERLARGDVTVEQYRELKKALE
jgi:uncharacterized membrane protein